MLGVLLDPSTPECRLSRGFLYRAESIQESMTVNSSTMVKEFTNPLKEPIDDDINLFDFLDRRAQRDPDGSTVEYKADGGWKSFSATQFRDLVIVLGKARSAWV